MKIMPPRRNTSKDDASSINSSPIQDLSLSLHELIRLQHQTPSPLQLDARFQLPNFSRKINGNIVDF
jgi:hypothetical protein